jgi:hypothetical protein
MERETLTAIAAQRGHASAGSRSPMSVADLRAALKARSKRRSTTTAALDPSAIRDLAVKVREARRSG